ncbi:hypothetical protein [Burkholderia ubonensis]|uniref:hypothetical protein n=1 Tax=Burkholderia ubonensis TaxID=101571 RepID=UPI0012FB80A9|nr:hypothetical protein [Burkholderia ubonensis]
MNVQSFGNLNIPTFDEMNLIGEFLISSLSDFFGIKFQTFKRHYVEEGSFVLTFRSENLLKKPLSIQIEGVVLFDIHPQKSLPLIDSEILIFSLGKRMGLQANSGSSFLHISYDVTDQSWVNPTWVADTPEDWEQVREAREAEYFDEKITYDRKE